MWLLRRHGAGNPEAIIFTGLFLCKWISILPPSQKIFKCDLGLIKLPDTWKEIQ